MEVRIQRDNNTIFFVRVLQDSGVCGCGQPDLTRMYCINACFT